MRRKKGTTNTTPTVEQTRERIAKHVQYLDQQIAKQQAVLNQFIGQREMALQIQDFIDFGDSDIIAKVNGTNNKSKE